ncbi:tetratricopeptide repeat-containing sensor histidine kinase [Fulvivirga lutea]|uniref:histidine kinase n=1 Tax=Fulvivirga lutea TaxID=2810512 RepID=A0A975A105_9BACT|nr:tetratricopeptide repeat protein [Fulvivirga lutea]QSE97914.1 tetratricopeptide repeat protein [Fulvivirga lutea]
MLSLLLLILFNTNPAPSDNYASAEVYHEKGAYDSAILKYKLAIAGYIQIDSTDKIGEAYYNMAKAYYSSYQDSNAITALDTASMYFKRAGNKLRLAVSINLKGNYLSDFGLNEEAIDHYKKSIQIAEEIGDKRVESFALNNLGLVYTDLGDYENALAALIKSYNIKLNRNAPPKELAASKLNIGSVLDLLGKPDEALQAYYEGILLKRKAGDSLGVAKILGNMAVIEKNRNNDVKAISLIQQSNDILNTTPDDELKYVNLTNLGGLSKKRNAFEDARNYYLQALDIAIKYDGKNEMSDLYYNLGELDFVQGNYLSAIEHLKKSLSITQTTQSQIQKKDIYSKLAQCYSQINEYDQAFEYLVLSNELRDSIYQFERIQTLEELQAKYDTENKQREIENQQLQLEAQQASLRENRIIITALAIGLILVFVIVYLILNRTRKKHELALQEKELEYRKSQISAIIDSQEKERKRFAQDIHDGFGQMISILNMNIASLQEKETPEEKATLFDQSVTILDGMYEELRTICFDLMPQTLVKQGLKEAIREFAARINIAGKLKIETQMHAADTRFDDLIEVSIFRITQEWINNIIKHSNADKVSIQLTSDEHELTLIIEDNGGGFDKNLMFNSMGNGWKNISSRANLMMAEINLDTSPQANQTTFIVNVPLSGTTIYHDEGIENEIKK